MEERIDPRDLLVKIAEILEKLDIPYIVSGGIALLVWGRPRFTADIDIVVELPKEKIPLLGRALQSLGEQGYIDQEMMLEAKESAGEFNFIDGVTGVKVDFWILRDTEFDKSRLQRRVAKKIQEKEIFFSTAEDLLLMKLLWYHDLQSFRQKEDIISILKISGSVLDRAYIHSWVAKLGLEEVFREIEKEML